MGSEPPEDALRETTDDPDAMNALTALRLAKLAVIELHRKNGLPIVIWRDGKVYHQPPEEAQREFEEAMKSQGWPSKKPPIRQPK